MASISIFFLGYDYMLGRGLLAVLWGGFSLPILMETYCNLLLYNNICTPNKLNVVTRYSGLFSLGYSFNSFAFGVYVSHSVMY